MTLDALLKNRMFRGNQSELARTLNITRNTLRKYQSDTKGKYHFVRCIGEDYELFTNQSEKV